MRVQGKRVLVTGGSGFLGRHVVSQLRDQGAQVFAPRSKEYNLTRIEDTMQALNAVSPDIVIHAAANVGGIGYNRLFPAQIFRDNLLMACNILEACARVGIEKLAIVGSACAYPGEASGDLREEQLLSGPLHPSVACYGLSKRALFIGSEAYRNQYGLNSIFLVITNLYGPWDKYDPNESHVVAALVRRFIEAKEANQPEVICWGTGTPVREFLYVEDCAQAISVAVEKYDKPGPLNIGTGIGNSIEELAVTTAEVVGYTGEIRWDTTKPDGALRKVLDVTRMKTELDWQPKTSLKEGLAATAAWYWKTVLGKEPIEQRIP